MRTRNTVITIILSLAFLALTAVFWQSYARFWEACKDFGLSVAYYVCELIWMRKGKGSRLIYQKWGSMKFKYRNRQFWCRGYYVDTVTYFYGHYG